MRRLLALLALFAACDPRTLPPYGEVLLVVDTDAPVPQLVSHFRLDVYSADGKRWLDSRDIARVDTHDWPVSLSVYTPDLANGHAALLRVRVYPDGKVRDYRGERLTTYPTTGDNKDPWPDPAPDKLQGPRLYDANGRDITPLHEPQPTVTIDRLLLVRLQPGVRGSVRIVMRGACFGTMADTTALASCVDTANVRVPTSEAVLDRSLEPPAASVHGSFAKPTACTIQGRPAHDGFLDEDVCIGGGGFVLGNRDVAELEDPSGRFAAGFPERIAVMRPFRIDRHEVTVARWRDAVARGFTSPDASPEVNDAPLDRSGNVGTSVFCTWSTKPLATENRETYPLNCVSWTAARAFCRFDGGDLPTEAQWEWVAQAYGRPEKTLFPWGDAEPDCLRSVFGRLDSSSGNNRCRKLFPQGPQPADTDAESDLSLGAGVIGLGGNVSELTRDAFVSMTAICWARATLDDPTCEDPTIDAHAYRGGDWAQNTLGVFSGVRLGQASAQLRSTVTGFRCVREAK